MAKHGETLVRGRDLAAERKIAGVQQIPVARLAGLNLGTLVDIERERVPVSAENIESIRAAIQTLVDERMTGVGA